MTAGNYRVVAPYITLKIVDSVSGTATMTGFYKDAVVPGERVEKASLERHLDRGYVEKVAEAAPAKAPEKAPESDPDAVPDDTAEKVLAWVGDDKARAERALKAEQAKQKPRTTLVDQLTKLANPA